MIAPQVYALVNLDSLVNNVVNDKQDYHTTDFTHEGDVIKGNLHNVVDNYNMGFQRFAFGLQNLDSLVNNVKNDKQDYHTTDFTHEGDTIKGNLHNVNDNYNMGFQRFAFGLQNLDSLVNNVKNDKQDYHTTDFTHEGDTIKGNLHNVVDNYNAGFQRFAFGI